MNGGRRPVQTSDRGCAAHAAAIQRLLDAHEREGALTRPRTPAVRNRVIVSRPNADESHSA